MRKKAGVRITFETIVYAIILLILFIVITIAIKTGVGRFIP